MDKECSLLHISPIDGRYSNYTSNLQKYFSEYALIYYRIFIEISYLKSLSSTLNLTDISKHAILDTITNDFSYNVAKRVKEYEKITNHDIKAIEYYIAEKCKELNMSHMIPYIHYGLTSQDINNTAIPLLLKNYINNIYLPDLKEIVSKLYFFTKEWQHIVIL